MGKALVLHMGIPTMDSAYGGIQPGENLVWKISDIRDFAFFAKALVSVMRQEQRRIVYIKFSDKNFFSEYELCEASETIFVIKLNLAEGFERTVNRILKAIHEEESNTVFLLDCLSDLLPFWYTDHLIDIFFRLITYEIRARGDCAYYSILHDVHSDELQDTVFHQAERCFSVYSDENQIFVQAIRMKGREELDVFLPHVISRQYGQLKAIKSGVLLSYFFSLANQERKDQEEFGSSRVYDRRDSWDRYFYNVERKFRDCEDITEECRTLTNMMLTREPKFEQLALKYFSPVDYMHIHRYMVGTGMVGGKAFGLLLAERILASKCPDVYNRMETIDAYYIGSDFYYMYVYENGLWGLMSHQREEEGYYTCAESFKDALIKGTFSKQEERDLQHIIDHYGHAPYVVRSSSVMEDGGQSAFAGKYTTVFCLNRGDDETRLEEFKNAIRAVYSSLMSEAVLTYRKKRGLDQKEDVMALLVQRVSGAYYGKYLMPAAAGVGYSTSPYRFSKDTKGGMIRLVMGLGTKAVDRIQGAYPRLISMEHPAQKILADDADRHAYSQRKIDAIDLSSKKLVGLDLGEIEANIPYVLKNLLLSHDKDAENYFRNMGDYRNVYYVSGDGIANNAQMMQDMNTILTCLQDAFGYTVDIEFAINIDDGDNYSINLLQCRPLRALENNDVVLIPSNIPRKNIILECVSCSMGFSRQFALDYIVFIDTFAYYALSYNDKYRIARAIGQINKTMRGKGKKVMLFVPGRICTSSPESGVPCTYAEIDAFNAICEISSIGAGYMPELSYGSHIFQDLVESNILYSAVSDVDKRSTLQIDILKNMPDYFRNFCEDLSQVKLLETVLHVYDLSNAGGYLYYSVSEEHLLCIIGGEI